MYCIGICDDEINVCNQLEEHLERYMKQQYMKAEILIFYTGETLCNFMESNDKISLLFLDIEIPKINGIEVGRYIRNNLENEVMDIVYISSKTSYAMELFQCRPLDFIVKPLDYKKIEQEMNIIAKRNQLTELYFECRSEGIEKKIHIRDIMYFKSDNKKVHIIKKKGEECFVGKLKDVKAKIPEETFLCIHKSYLINYEYVGEYSYEWVKMINGDTLNISKAHRSEVRRKLMEHEFINNSEEGNL